MGSVLSNHSDDLLCGRTDSTETLLEDRRVVVLPRGKVER